MEATLIAMLAGVGLYLIINRRATAALMPQPAAVTPTLDTQAGSASTPISNYQPGGFISTTPPLSAVGLGQQMSGHMGTTYNLLEAQTLYAVPTPSAQVTQAPGGSPVTPASNPAAPIPTI
jgi:hypothetical protein